MSEASLGEVRSQFLFGARASHEVAGLLAESQADTEAVGSVAVRLASLRDRIGEIAGEIEEIYELVDANRQRVVRAGRRAEDAYMLYDVAGQGSGSGRVHNLVAGAKAQFEALESSNNYVISTVSSLEQVSDTLVGLTGNVDSSSLSCRNWGANLKGEQQRAQQLGDEATAIANEQL